MGKRTTNPKTNAARLLDQLGIPYELRTYDPGSGHLAAAEVAAQVGMDPRTVFKTLLAEGDRNGHCMAVIPAIAELDLKALARASGDRKFHMVPLKQVQPLTGYVRGGVTALATRRPLPVFVDDSALAHNSIAVSAGQRGMQLLLDPTDYVRACNATPCSLAR